MPEAIRTCLLSLHCYPPDRACHSHAYHQIILPLHGTMELEADGRGGVASGALGSGEFAVVAAGHEHAYRGIGNNRVLTLDVPDKPHTDEARLWDAASDQTFFFAGGHLNRLLEFARASRNGAFHTETFRSGLGSLLFFGLTEQIAGRNACEPEALLKAMAFVRAHFTNSISVPDMAGAAHVSTATLHRLFRAWLGKSPAQYLREVRLERAKALLSSGNEPPAQIALACGYSEQSSLTRALRREHGTTPGQYRRRARRPLNRASPRPGAD